MAGLILNKKDGDLVIFHFFKSMEYSTRMIVSFALIMAGVGLQIYNIEIFPGIVLLFCGNLLLLTKGYNNNPDFGSYNPKANWQEVAPEKLSEIISLHKKMKEWDKSSVDITSSSGAVIFFLIIIGIIILLLVQAELSSTPLLIIALNTLVLLIPHWLTGTKKILTRPKLINKITFFKEVIADIEKDPDINIEYNMLLADGKAKLPQDVKLRLKANGQHEDFLGMYCQIALNNVQGSDYPYFYVVLVSKKDFDIQNAYKNYDPPSPLIKEFELKTDVKVLIIRQRTTKNSGYHTNTHIAREIINEGANLMKKII